MEILNKLGTSLELALTVNPNTTIAEDMRQEGNKFKLVGLLRTIPPSVLSVALEYIRTDNLPFADFPIRPIKRGCEMTVYPISKHGIEYVVKLNHSRVGVEKLQREYHENQAILQKYFPNILEPSQPFVYAHEYQANTTRFGMIQKRIDGKCIFGHKGVINQQDAQELVNGIEKMQIETNLIPDIIGDGNILVDKNGRIKIVDSGDLKIRDDIFDNNYEIIQSRIRDLTYLVEDFIDFNVESNQIPATVI